MGRKDSLGGGGGSSEKERSGLGFWGRVISILAVDPTPQAPNNSHLT